VGLIVGGRDVDDGLVGDAVVVITAITTGPLTTGHHHPTCCTAIHTDLLTIHTDLPTIHTDLLTIHTDLLTITTTMDLPVTSVGIVVVAAGVAPLQRRTTIPTRRRCT
jgi:hypothetical protein